MNLKSQSVRGVVTAGLVVALGVMAPAGVALAEDPDAPVSAVEAEASSMVYVDPSGVGGEDTYVTLGEAFDNVATGGTVQLKGDVAYSGTLNVYKNVTLDLANHTVSAPSGACIFVEVNHTLTVDGGGTFESLHYHVLMVFGTLIAKDCTMADNSNSSRPAIWVGEQGKVSIEGSAITTSVGPSVDLSTGATLVVKSGSLRSPAGTEVVYAPPGAVVSVSGGTFSSPVHAEWCAEGYAPRMVTYDDPSAGYTVGRAIERPAATNRTYNGAEQYGADGAEGMVLSGGGTNVGSYTTTATPADDYAWKPSDASSEAQRSKDGTAPITLGWTISPKELEATMVSAPAQTYDGTPKTPVTVSIGATKLAEGTDYTISYTNNTNAGTAGYTIMGTGNVVGELSGTFPIEPANIANATFGTIPDQTYTGKPLTPKVTVTYAGKTLVAGTDYEVAYANNTKTGTATVTIQGKGNFQGTKTLTFAIVSPKTTKKNASTSSTSTKAATSSSTKSSLPDTADRASSATPLGVLLAGLGAAASGARRARHSNGRPR